MPKNMPKNITKKERKLLKAASRLEKITKKYLKQLMKIDKTMQKMPFQVARCYGLEQDYFEHVPKIATATVHLELLHSKLAAQLETLPEETY